MAAKSEDESDQEPTVQRSSPEDLSLRQARRALIFAILTPVWWIVMIILINLLAGLFPSTNPDSTFVFITWSVMALIFTITVVYTGLQQGRLIRQYEVRRGRHRRVALHRCDPGHHCDDLHKRRRIHTTAALKDDCPSTLTPSCIAHDGTHVCLLLRSQFWLCVLGLDAWW